VREAKEEPGIEISEADLKLVHTMQHREGRLALFFEVRKWSGEINDAEPDKCASLA
jgi:hypothetical protein